jgi:hypothetical protein
MSVPIRDFLKARRDRAVGSVMGYAEREIFHSLVPGQQVNFRRVIIEAINGYHDSVLDLMKAEDSTTVRNEEVLTTLDRLERIIVNGLK